MAEPAGIQTGPYVAGGQWTARLVKALFCDPVLSGTRTFRKTIYRRVYSTGKHRRDQNAEPATRHCPELAHITEAEQRELVDAMGWSLADCEAQPDRPSSRRGVPRRRSFWPGQAAKCGVCRGPMHVMGKHLKCANALPQNGRRCWNRVQVSLAVVRRRLHAWLMCQFQAHPEALADLVDAAWRTYQTARQASPNDHKALERSIERLDRQAANLAAAIAEGEIVPLLNQLKAVEKQLAAEKAKLAESAGRQDGRAGLGDKGQIPKRVDAMVEELIACSFDCAELLRQALPVFLVRPVQRWTRGRSARGAIWNSPPLGHRAPTRRWRRIELDLFEAPRTSRQLRPAWPLETRRVGRPTR